MSDKRNLILTPEQCRMARAALRLTVKEVSLLAKAAHNTIVYFESGDRETRELILARIRKALEKKGARFSITPVSATVTVPR